MIEFLVSPPYENITGRSLAHASYKIESGRLMRAPIPHSNSGDIMIIRGANDICNAELAREIHSECLRHGYCGVLLASTSACALCDFLLALSITVYVPIECALHCKGAKILVPGIISGGSFREYLGGLAHIYGENRLAVELYYSALDFTMPSAMSSGETLNASELGVLMTDAGKSFFSSELCCNYFLYEKANGEAHFVMFDDAHSIKRKIEIANELNLAACFIWQGATAF
ncbi:MAG: hypothetical protein RSC43_05285 [Clostridia bacterium]